MPKDSMTFLEFFQSFRRGELATHADNLLAELTAAVKDTGLKGELSIKFPFVVNKAGQIECEPAVTVKVPRRPVGVGLYFVNDEGRLTRRDPNQDDLFDELAERRAGFDS